MEYFRQSLIKYNPDRELSTFLHIHVETDKPKMLFPLSKGKSYVDSLMQQYTVNMYSYPQLSQIDNKLAFSLTHPSKSNQSTFHIYEPKRKPIKKVVVKKFTPPIQPIVPIQVIPPIPIVPTEPQNFKICSCCNAKVIVKHKCDHSLCQKPCNKIKKHRVSQGQMKSQVQQAVQKQQILQQDEFVPNQNQGQNQESRFSHSEHQSDYQEDMEISSIIQSSQFLSHEQRKKTHDRRKRPRKDMNKKRKRLSQRGRSNVNRICGRNFDNERKRKQEALQQNENFENMNIGNDLEHESERQKQQKRQVQTTKHKKKPIRKVTKKRKSYSSQSQSNHSEQDIYSSINEGPKQRIQSISKSDSLRKKPSLVESNSGLKKGSKIWKYCKGEDLKEEVYFYIKIGQSSMKKDGEYEEGEQIKNVDDHHD